jgi:hypothetical protein
MGDGGSLVTPSFFTNKRKMYIIPGTSAHAQIYKNAKGKKLEDFKVVLGKMISNNIDFGASIFPKGQSILLSFFAKVRRTSPTFLYLWRSVLSVVYEMASDAG